MLAKAVKKGEWILLDEINLAAAETLECLSGLLEGSSGSLVLLDRGDTGTCLSENRLELSVMVLNLFFFFFYNTRFEKNDHVKILMQILGLLSSAAVTVVEMLLPR